VGTIRERPDYGDKLAKMEAKQALKVAKVTGEDPNTEKIVRLNKYIANAGICSRRDADALISSGQIKVNGEVIAEMGHKVYPTDVVSYLGKTLKPEGQVYILLNKPKDYITTTEDPENRHTVMELIKGANHGRIFPVGRLDRNTTGLLVLTNDGDLAEKMTHPSFETRKIYQVDLNKPIEDEDFQTIKAGIELEDGPAMVDEIEILSPGHDILGLALHSGRNRIVRRIFESLGYDVIRLDRVMYASLTKKDLPRGHWRYLSEQEVIRLKYFMK
jgi:23S rRNA pseudouridine2605 synthase